jgi:DNA-binding CsgD family transcriptional regulator
MKALSKRAVRVLDFLRDLYARRAVDAFASEVVQSLPQLIATDLTSFNEVDVASGQNRTLVAPAGADRFPGSEEVFERHVREHPYVVHVRRFEDGQAHRLSDFMGRGDFRRLAIYNEYYRRIGTEHQVAVALPFAAPWVRGIALSRASRDYSDHERDLLAALAPHMVQAYENAEILAGTRAGAVGTIGEDAAASGIDVEVVLLSPAGRIHFATPRARRWLAAYFGGSSPRDARLPRRLADWLRDSHSGREEVEAVPPARWPRIVQRDGAHLEIRLAAECGHRALLLRERRHHVHAEVLAPLELSPREAQVLAWVAEGKTNGEIAVILDARPRTVAKHLERIFRKLGVETRTAAAAVALTLAACPEGSARAESARNVNERPPSSRSSSRLLNGTVAREHRPQDPS